MDKIRARGASQHHSALIIISNIVVVALVSASAMNETTSGKPEQRNGHAAALATTKTRGEDPLELAKSAGQLESFSMEATGLGDLEEADAIRIMMRRSWDHRKHLEPIKSLPLAEAAQSNERDRRANRMNLRPDDGAMQRPLTTSPSHNQQARQDVAATTKYHERLLRSLLKKRAPMAIRLDHDYNEPQAEVSAREIMPHGGARFPGESPPIAIRRRTAEELLDGQLSSEDAGDLDDMKLGEFGSRISLLTTRKIQPEAVLVDKVFAKFPDFQKLPLDHVRPRDAADAPVNIRDVLITLLGAREGQVVSSRSPNGGMDSPGEEQSTLIGVNSNYLPRVARSYYL